MILLLIILLTLSVSAQDFKSDIEKYLNQRLNGFDKIEYSVLNDLKQNNYVIDYNRELKIKGNIAYLPIKFSDNDKWANSILTLQLKLYKQVPVASREIQRKEKIDDNFYTLQSVDVSSLKSRVVELSDLEKSLRAKMIIKQGEVITQDLVEETPVIHSGSKVVAECIKGSVVVSTEAIARQDGKMNQIIDVLTSSNELLKAKVINSQKVLIE
ncbi:flagellar basal body P-ring formation chaperone FlgA [Ignavibacterium sp.]|uniref:flagellar basal body P-ring formation chaperone FlgA n=1 Tax=Ignavibacterium sp. TaxID=2651167 RepID=UPI00307D7700